MAEARLKRWAGYSTHGGTALRSYMAKGIDTGRMTNWAIDIVYHSVRERKTKLMTTL